ncbi:MAG: hypothetical protein AB7E61_07200 [Acholeplasmataceae bacterium]
MVIFNTRKKVESLEKEIESIKKKLSEQQEIITKLNTIYGVELLKQSTQKVSVEDAWLFGSEEKKKV